MKEPVLKNKNKCVKAKKIAGLALSVALGANSIFFGINALNSRKNADKFLDKYKACENHLIPLVYHKSSS